MATEHVVWFDWGSGRREDVCRYAFPTLEELNAFVRGAEEGADRGGLEDYRQFDSEAELDEVEWLDQLLEDDEGGEA